MADPLYGVDLGQAYATAENIKGARTRNKLAELQLKKAEQEVADQPKREQRNKMLVGLRQKAVTGDRDAQNQLLALDPKGGAEFIQAISKMDNAQLEKTKQSVEDVGRMSATVLNAPPERQASLYQQMLSMLPEASRSKMPTEFDPDFMQLSLSKATAMDKILENPKAIQVGGEDVVYKQGREIERKTRPVKETPSKTNELKSADESLMYRQAAELMGGMFDESGNLRALDPSIRPKVQQIATRATELFQQGGITRSQAVTRAAEEIESGAGQQYKEGQRAKDAAGNIIVFTNGQWVPER